MKNNNSAGVVDLHVHTNFSDGILSPEEVVTRAINAGLKAIGITDHDCIEGIAPAMKAAENTGLEIVPGVEISASRDKGEVHILGYFIDRENPELLKALDRMKENRVERMRKMLDLLREKNIDIDEEKVTGDAPDGTVGRLQLARAMVRENAVRDLKEAFDRYIGNGKPCHVGHEYLGYEKAIEIIKKAGGVPVLAHPGTMGKDAHIPLYVNAGLRGLEAYHSKHWPGTADRYLRVAAKYGLLITGGSDCHGMGKEEILLGRIRVGYDIVEKLREEAEKIRNEQV
ncbi:PHP domain-containing protein [Candidatus Omnitrophota bacterium]